MLWNCASFLKNNYYFTKCITQIAFKYLSTLVAEPTSCHEFLISFSEEWFNSDFANNFLPDYTYIAAFHTHTRVCHQNCSSLVCPSLTVPNLLPNKHELTIQVCSGDHSWSFQSIPIHSNSILLMRIGSAGEYESFEHVQKFCVVTSNIFHSCLCALKTSSYRVCRTAYVLYSNHSHCILVVLTVY